MTTRRSIVKAGAGLAAIIAAGRAPAALIRSALAARNALMAGKRLPYDAEVEYLESTGTQWIDTGVVPTDSHGFAVDVYVNFKSYVRNDRIIGVQETGRWLLSFQASSSNTFFGWNSAIDLLGAFYYRNTASLNFLNDRTGIINNVVKVTNLPVLTSFTRSAALFANVQNGNVNTDQILIGRIYAAKISEGIKLVRDFSPVRFTNEQGVSEGAMYDRANPNAGMNPDGSARDDGLYRNRGTGAFVIGPDI